MSLAARLVRREQLTPSITTFWLQPAQPVSFLAGQYIELILPHDGVDNRGEQRWFTISSSPQDELVGLTTRLEASPSSYKRHLHALPVGAALQLGEVLGDFVAPKDRSIPLVFVGGGLGIAPFASIIKDLHEHNDRRTIHLFQSARAGEERLFEAVFQAYGVQPKRLLVGRSPEAAEILQALPEQAIDQALFYLAGSERTVLRQQHGLLAASIKPMHIGLDYFPGYSED